MALRGKKPETVKKRLKALFFGPPGVGKTTAAIQFPQPYVIDTERGAENEQYVKLLRDAGGAYFFTTDLDEMLSEVMQLLTEKHDYRTLVIDPLTVAYNDLLDKSIKRIAEQEQVDEDAKAVTAFGRHKQSPDRKIKHLCTLITRLDMNVILTSHQKSKWEKDASGNAKETGATFDCYPKLEYLFDLVFQIQERGTERKGIVVKTRCDEFPKGEVFPFSYEEIANRYGRDILERKAHAETLATPEQVGEITRLVDLLKTPLEITDKWLDKAMAETFAEMPADAIQKCIDHLRKQVTAAA